MKTLLTLGLLLTCVARLHGAEKTLYFTLLQYTENQAPQGEYCLSPDQQGLISLTSISGSIRPQKVTPAEIIPTLEKAYPALAGKVSVEKHSLDPAKLAKQGLVYVLGLVKSPGNHPIGSLATCVNLAQALPSSATHRIIVSRTDAKGKTTHYLYDIRKTEHASVMLKAGDIIHIPAKHWVGR